MMRMTAPRLPNLKANRILWIYGTLNRRWNRCPWKNRKARSWNWRNWNRSVLMKTRFLLSPLTKQQTMKTDFADSLDVENLLENDPELTLTAPGRRARSL